MTEPLDWTLCEAAAAIRRREISSTELTTACLARIATLQPSLNAFVAVDEEAALAAARAADAGLHAGAATGPLHGVPLAHKDMYYRAGGPCGCGSIIRRDFVPTRTATVLERLDAAGALSLGRLNMSEFAIGPTGDNAHHGRARNPWSPEHVTGGSSSGSGVAVAAGMVFGALGSDTGGSIRLPAAMCGTVGLKATTGRVSRAGAMPLSHSLDIVGPLTRSVADTAAIYQVIAGADPRDPTTAGLPVTPADLGAARSLAGHRIGVPTTFYVDGLDDEVAAAVAGSLRTLADLGAELVEVEVPDQAVMGDLSAIVSMSEAGALHLDWLRERPQDYGPQVRARLLQGMVLPAAAYLRALQMRAQLLQRFLDSVFAHCDLLHLPVLPFVTPTSRAVDIGDAPGMAAVIADTTRFTRPISFLGLPALSVPAAMSSGGLPIGMQLVGRPFDEATLLAVGHVYETAVRWTERRCRPPGTAA